MCFFFFFFFFQAEDGIRDLTVTGVQTCALPISLADPTVYERRQRLCDLSYLRTPFLSASGEIGYRCPSEPVHMFLRKGGAAEETAGRTCLCNALTSDVGL